VLPLKVPEIINDIRHQASAIRNRP